MKIVVIALSLFGAAGAVAEPWEVTEGEWALPRNGEALARHASLSAAVGRLLEAPGSSLELHYAGGDDGLLWVSELRGWLIALGIESSRIELVPGSGRTDRIRLQVVEHPIGAGTYP